MFKINLIDVNSVADRTGETIGRFYRTVSSCWWYRYTSEQCRLRKYVDKVAGGEPIKLEDIVSLEEHLRRYVIGLGPLDRGIMVLNAYISKLWEGLCYSCSSPDVPDRLSALQKRVNKLMERN